jgi:hypothetical protein
VSLRPQTEPWDRRDQLPWACISHATRDQEAGCSKPRLRLVGLHKHVAELKQLSSLILWLVCASAGRMHHSTACILRLESILASGAAAISVAGCVFNPSSPTPGSAGCIFPRVLVTRCSQAISTRLRPSTGSLSTKKSLRSNSAVPASSARSEMSAMKPTERSKVDTSSSSELEVPSALLFMCKLVEA